MFLYHKQKAHYTNDSQSPHPPPPPPPPLPPPPLATVDDRAQLNLLNLKRRVYELARTVGKEPDRQSQLRELRQHMQWCRDRYPEEPPHLPKAPRPGMIPNSRSAALGDLAAWKEKDEEEQQQQQQRGPEPRQQPECTHTERDMINKINQTSQAIQELNKQWQQTYQNLHTMQLPGLFSHPDAAETVAVNALNHVVDIEGRAESASKAAPAPACVPAAAHPAVATVQSQHPACVPAAAHPAVATVQSQHQAAVHATHATSRHDDEDTSPPKNN